MNSPVVKTFTAALLVSAFAACGPDLELGTAEQTAATSPQEGGQLIQSEAHLLADCTSTIALSNGATVTNISADSGYWSCIYTVNVPAGTSKLTLTMAGGSGDSDLYVKYGSVPELSVYDCRDYTGGPAGTCSISNPTAGTWYVRLRAYSSFSGVSLTAQYGASNPTDCTLTYALSNGTPVTGISAGTGTWSCIYTLNVPAGATNLKFTTSGGTGNVILYTNFGSPPTSTTYECWGNTSTNDEVCINNSPRAGTYYVRLQGVTAASGITLTVSYGNTSCSATSGLINGTPMTNVSAATGDWSCIYTLNVPAGATNLKFTTSGGTGNGDLYVKFGAVPTASIYGGYDCKSYSYDNWETCTITNPQAGTYYVRMFNLINAFSGVTLTGSYTGGSGSGGNVLQNGVAVSNISGATGSEQIWSLDVPSGTSTLTFTTTGGSGDADLTVKFGATPADATYVCGSGGTSNNEACTIPNPTAGRYYAVIKGFSAFSGLTLKGQY